MRGPSPILVGALLAMSLAGARLAVADGPALLAWPGAEVWGHAWVQWWHGEALPAWPSGTPLAAGARPWPVMDPLPTLLAGLIGRLGSYVLAWNAVVLGGVGLAFWGGAALARAWGGEPRVGGVVLATAPIFLGSLASGLTEDAALGLVALALAFLKRGRMAAGGLTLGLSAWCGLYLAWFGALLALALGLVDLARARGLRWAALRRWALAAALALALALPALTPHARRVGAGEGHRGGEVALREEPLWRVNPWRGADLASFWAPGPAPLEGHEQVRLHPTYLGWVALLLALAGGRSRWWLVLAAAMALSLGRGLSWTGAPLGVANPAVSLAGLALPLAERVNHHARWMLLGELALAVLAARGARRLLGEGARLKATALSLAVALEVALVSPAPLPLPLASARVAPIWAAAAGGEGAVLPVPSGGPGVHFQRPLFDQRAHGRPLAISPNRPGPAPGVGADPLGRWLGGLGLPHAPPAPAIVEVEGLRRAGVGAVLVLDPRVPEAEAVLGPPTLRAEGGALWSLDGRAP